MAHTDQPLYMFANWKMYLNYDESNIVAHQVATYAREFSNDVTMVVFPSALALYPVGQTLRDVGVSVGAQNIFSIETGGYTGEVSAAMYQAAGCEYALVGHSERRHLFHEDNHAVNQKMLSTLAVGLIPILCVGETADEHRENKAQSAIEVQLRAAFNGVVWPVGRPCFVAYEPVWAVGSGTACDPMVVNQLLGEIARLVGGLLPGITPILLYGGSVRSDNVAEYVQGENCNGVLVGHASADAVSWRGIIEEAVSTKKNFNLNV